MRSQSLHGELRGLMDNQKRSKAVPTAYRGPSVCFIAGTCNVARLLANSLAARAVG